MLRYRLRHMTPMEHHWLQYRLQADDAVEGEWWSFNPRTPPAAASMGGCRAGQWMMSSHIIATAARSGSLTSIADSLVWYSSVPSKIAQFCQSSQSLDRYAIPL